MGTQVISSASQTEYIVAVGLITPVSFGSGQSQVLRNQNLDFLGPTPCQGHRTRLPLSFHWGLCECLGYLNSQVFLCYITLHLTVLRQGFAIWTGWLVNQLPGSACLCSLHPLSAAVTGPCSHAQLFT